MQLDVKHVPKHCKYKNLPLDKKYYHTIIDEASRERFIYFLINTINLILLNFL